MSLQNTLSDSSEQKTCHFCKTKLLKSKPISKGVSKRRSFPLNVQAGWLIGLLGELRINLVTQVKESSGKVVGQLIKSSR